MYAHTHTHTHTHIYLQSLTDFYILTRYACYLYMYIVAHIYSSICQVPYISQTIEYPRTNRCLHRLSPHRDIYACSSTDILTYTFFYNMTLFVLLKREK
uniref:Uncharacterized protein n=1 Tax=Octopus bimaculoides TaxID=37653 RepID=A0A0L8IED6_OCTBM